MDPSVIHVFFVIMTIAGKPFVGDLYEDRFKFTTIFKIAYGCRGKDSI